MYYRARVVMVEWQALAARKRRQALTKREAGVYYQAGIPWAIEDLREAAAIRKLVGPLPK